MRVPYPEPLVRAGGRATLFKDTRSRLRFLMWLAVVAPFLFLVLVHILLHTVLLNFHDPPGIVLVSAVVALGVASFSFIIFGIVNRLETQVLEQNRILAALLAVGRATVASLDLSEILDKALETILDVTSAVTAEVWLRSGEQELVLERQRGVADEAFRERTRFKWGEGLPGLAAKERVPILVNDLEADPRFLRESVKMLGFKSFCALPLIHRSEVVGVLAVASRNRDALQGETERGLLEGIGERLAIAIENSHLHEQVLDQAVLKERERIARELHDGLAQVLGYINTQTMATKRLVESKQLVEAQEQLNSMEEATRKVYADVREAIMGLGSPLTSRDGLIGNLKQYLLDYSDLAGITVDLNTGNGNKIPQLPASMELQLMRIFQEALSNIRKHSKATNASISFDSSDIELTARIVDDGCGFTPDQQARTGWPHFGLRSMSERANAIGGTLEVLSAPNQGTKVVMRLPLANQTVNQ